MSHFKNSDAAEAAFYHAFANCDIKAMESVWAKDDAVCIHPGASVLVGYAAVIRSWSGILLNAQLPQLRYEVLHKTIQENLAIHIVKESIAPADNPLANAIVIATNIYIRDDVDGWLIREHHASATRQEIERHTLQ